MEPKLKKLRLLLFCGCNHFCNHRITPIRDQSVPAHEDWRLIHFGIRKWPTGSHTGGVEPPGGQVDGLDLIYKIEGEPNELDIFELVKVLEAFGTVLKEGYRVVHPNAGDLTVSVKPFERGSFIIDLPLDVRDAAEAGLLFFSQHHQQSSADI